MAVLPWVLGGLGILNGLSSANTAKKNLQAQREANATNLQMTRETNEANLNLAREQNRWNLEQWNRQNQYNSPVAQMGRYSSAGINPYMAIGQVNSGNAESNLESAQLSNQQAGHVNPALGDPGGEFVRSSLGGIAQFAQTVAQIKKTEAETARTNTETQSLASYYGAMIEKINAESAGQRYNNRVLKLQSSDYWLNNMQNLQDLSLAQGNNVANILDSQLRQEWMKEHLLDDQTFMSSIDRNTKGQFTVAALADKLSQIEARKQQILQEWQKVNQGWKGLKIQQQHVNNESKLTDAQYRHYIAMAAESEARRNGIELSNRQLEEYVNHVVEIIPKEFYLMKEDLDTRIGAHDWNKEHKFLNPFYYQRQYNAFFQDMVSPFPAATNFMDDALKMLPGLVK